MIRTTTNTITPMTFDSLLFPFYYPLLLIGQSLQKTSFPLPSQEVVNFGKVVAH